MDKEEHYQLIKECRAKLETNACQGCSCPEIKCEWHGDCYNCVRLHRIYADHVPRCLQLMLYKKVEQITEIAEMTASRKPTTPGDYWDYVRQRDEGMPPEKE
jgi:hypothetical protein